MYYIATSSDDPSSPICLASLNCPQLTLLHVTTQSCRRLRGAQEPCQDPEVAVAALTTGCPGCCHTWQSPSGWPLTCGWPVQCCVALAPPGRCWARTWSRAALGPCQPGATPLRSLPGCVLTGHICQLHSHTSSLDAAGAPPGVAAGSLRHKYAADSAT